MYILLTYVISSETYFKFLCWKYIKIKKNVTTSSVWIVIKLFSRECFFSVLLSQLLLINNFEVLGVGNFSYNSSCLAVSFSSVVRELFIVANEPVKSVVDFFFFFNFTQSLFIQKRSTHGVDDILGN